MPLLLTTPHKPLGPRSYTWTTRSCQLRSCRRLMRSARGAGTIARVTDGQSARVSEAIVVWSGHGITRWPQPDETRLVERFGEERALTLLHAVTRLYDEFYEPDAHLTAPDLVRWATLRPRGSENFIPNSPTVRSKH
jgi:hypothetical protein